MILEQEKKTWEEVTRVKGAELAETLKKLVREGNVRRIVVRDTTGTELINLPLTGLFAVAILGPVLTAIGTVAVLALDYTIHVERRAPKAVPTESNPLATGAVAEPRDISQEIEK